jgi:hypothetical protein
MLLAAAVSCARVKFSAFICGAAAGAARRLEITFQPVLCTERNRFCGHAASVLLYISDSLQYTSAVGV